MGQLPPIPIQLILEYFKAKKKIQNLLNCHPSLQIGTIPCCGYRYYFSISRLFFMVTVSFIMICSFNDIIILLLKANADISCAISTLFCLGLVISHASLSKCADFATVVVDLQCFMPCFAMSNVNVVTPAEYLEYLIHNINRSVDNRLQVCVTFFSPNHMCVPLCSVVQISAQLTENVFTICGEQSALYILQMSLALLSHPQIVDPALVIREVAQNVVLKGLRCSGNLEGFAFLDTGT
jgi:hypothetical protein